MSMEVNGKKHPPKDSMDSAQNRWQVYMILASDNKIYTGVTTDIKRRWIEHSSGSRGAKFFRGRNPTSLIYLETGHSHSSALRQEIVLKSMTKTQKWHQVSSKKNQAKRLIKTLPVQLDPTTQTAPR